MRVNFPSLLVSTISASLSLATFNSAFAGTIISGTLSDPTYSGSFQVSAGGYICGSGACSPQTSSTSQSIIGPGSLSYSGSAPLISDGSGSVPPSNYTPGATASGSFSFSQQPSPSMTMSGTVSTVGVNGANSSVVIGNATMNYLMEINGPTPTVSVQVDAHGGITISSIASGGFANYAQVFFGINGEFSDNLNVDSSDGLGTRTFSDTHTYTLSTNHQYTLELYGHLVNEVSGNLGGGTSTISGFIDPTFTVVADDPSAYTLNFSQGIGNVGAVPEPSTWAMMILGFCGLGWMAYRRTKGAIITA